MSDLLDHCKISQVLYGETLRVLTPPKDDAMIPDVLYVSMHRMHPDRNIEDRDRVDIIKAILTGDGIDIPSGVMNCDEIKRIEGGITHDRVIDAIYHVPANMRRNGVFVVGMRGGSVGDVRSLKDTDGRFAWGPGMSTAEPDRLFDFPLFYVDGVGGLLFGSFSDGYAIGLNSHSVGGMVSDPNAFCIV